MLNDGSYSGKIKITLNKPRAMSLKNGSNRPAMALDHQPLNISRRYWKFTPFRSRCLVHVKKTKTIGYTIW